MQGQPGYRANQVYEWIWQKSAVSFGEMSNIPKGLRSALESKFQFRNIAVHHRQESADGTVKFSFVLHDGHFIEGVLIPTERRLTACISSQVGCSLSCKFCATGFLGRKRNLNPDEIYDQVVIIRNEALERYEKALTNIVFMGMGEPLLNYKNVLEAISRITGEDGLGISSKRVTVSTAGVAKMIRKLGDDRVKFHLALSLHATTDEQRSRIMPVNDQNPLDDLLEALNYFYRQTKGRITFEYILFRGLNDSIDDARRLVKICRRVPARVNVIEYNAVEGANFSRSDPDQKDRFVEHLHKNEVNASYRVSRGKDIDAACGQLANKV